MLVFLQRENNFQNSNAKGGNKGGKEITSNQNFATPEEKF